MLCCLCDGLFDVFCPCSSANICIVGLCLLACLCVCLIVGLFVFVFVTFVLFCLFVSLRFVLYVCQSVYVAVVCLLACLCVCPFVCLPMYVLDLCCLLGWVFG